MSKHSAAAEFSVQDPGTREVIRSLREDLIAMERVQTSILEQLRACESQIAARGRQIDALEQVVSEVE